MSTRLDYHCAREKFRADGLDGSLASLALLGSVGCQWTSREPPPPEKAGHWLHRVARGARPNILFVVYDARRRDDFSFGPQGNRRGDTPFLAAFEQEAVSFADAVSPGCWTVPVHSSMFSGLSVCELGNDVFTSAWATFPNHFLSLAEILSLAGYRTVSFADHPFFYGLNPGHGGELAFSLLRGFELFSVVNDFGRFGVRTNVGTEGGRVELRHDLAGPAVSVAALASEVAAFNAGRLRVDPGQADFDPVRQVHVARLDGLFSESRYLQKRYIDPFDRHVFNAPSQKPFFLFLNLHMATYAAVPEPMLHARWCARTLMLNAAARGARLPEVTEDFPAWVARSFASLGLRHDGFPDPAVFLKQVFDNRFYDACFEGVWNYLEARGLTSNMVTIVTSDHGMSLGDKGDRVYRHDGARPHEYVTRVPLVIRFPPGSPSASLHGRYTQRVSLTDVFTTMLDVGLGPGVFERDLPVRGRGLVSRIRENDFDPVQVTESMVAPDGYASEPEAGGHSKAVYWRNLKLILMPDPRRVRDLNWPNNLPLDAPFSKPRGAIENDRMGRELAWLYDLEADPHETLDLAKGRPETVATLKRLLGDQWSCHTLGPSARAAPTPEWDEDALETLRALGYIR